ncbi:MAG: hypothetical protein AAF597_20605, partial [Bacteroidota bacterium]
MKRILCWTLGLLCSVVTYAQTDVSLSLQQGYVHNVFRNPNTFTPQNGTVLSSSELLQSGVFTDAAISADWEQNWKHNTLGLGGDVGAQLFPNLEVANVLNVDLKQSFEQRLSKQLRIYQKAGIRIKRRQGSDAAEDLFTLPNAYRQTDYLLGLRWKSDREHLFRLEGGRIHKNYQPSETAELRYTATQFRLYHRYRFTDTDRLKYLTTTLRYQNRWYTRERFILDDEDTPEGEDDLEDLEDFTEYYLRYWVLAAKLDYDLGEYWRLSPSLELSRRLSDEDRLQYWQIEPGVKVRYERDKWKANVRTTLTYRNTPFLEPGELELPLTY